MLRLVNFSIFLVLVLGVVSGAYGTTVLNSDGGHTIYVSKVGTDRNDGLTPDKAKRNIINALNVAGCGDTVVVGPGVYCENLVIDKNITLIGTNQENTVIDGHHADNCIKIRENTTVKIVGFTIKNGIQQERTIYFGGGIYNIGGNVTVENSTITDNSAEYGGGIYIRKGGVMVLHGVTIKNNRAIDGSGAGIKNLGTLTAEDSTITDNISEFNAGGFYNEGTAVFKRVTIKNNQAGEGRKYEDRRFGGGILNRGSLIVEDSLIMDNCALDGGGGIYNGRLLYLYGTTITHNTARFGGGLGCYGTGYVDDVTVSLTLGNTPNNFDGSYIPA